MSKLALHGGPAIFDPPLELNAHWPPVDATTAQRLQEVYYSRRWTAFDDTERQFAEAFAQRHDARYGVFTVNGTVTLQIALAAYGIGAGDEVIVAPLTWYATAMAVKHVGARPVFVDIKPDTLCIDPDRIEEAITSRTKAVIPVHAYGAMADMDRIVTIARKHGLRVIEDCAHVHGGQWAGQGAGSIGDVGSFSFQYTKTMSCGEGGICITNNREIADRMFRLKQIGYGYGELPRQAKSGPPPGLVCYNLRATAFHPVILERQLELLPERLERYKRAVDHLEGRLRVSTKIRFQKIEGKITRQGRFGWVLIFDDPAYRHVPIEQIRQALLAEGVPLFRAEGPIYRFILFNLQPHDYGLDRPCTVTENTCERSLWMLHAYLGLDDQGIARIAEAIEKVLNNLDELREVGGST